jgi:DNA processing protein
MDNLLDLMICRVPGLKANERVELIKKFDKEDDFSILSIKDIENLVGRALRVDCKMSVIRSLAEKDADKAGKLGIRIVSWREENYPPLCREIYDPPALLFYRGVLPDPVKPMAAVVGTRKPSSQGAQRAFDIGYELGMAGIPVVSGLALGIDAMAHRGNVEAGSPTAAVLGSSPDMVYPVSNRSLVRRILDTGGVILSEYSPGTGPRRWNFPERNRIISALARGTIIVEAPEKSGALITARFAVEQGRDLWVDKAGISAQSAQSGARSAGTIRLAEEGASIYSSVKDILSEWHLEEAAVSVQREGDEAEGLASSMAAYLDIKL